MKKLLCLALSAILLCGLAACGGAPSSSDGPSSSPASRPSSQTQPAESVPEEIIELNQAFLTGLPKDADYPEGKRITAVMLNNVPHSRPQNGIGDAQILVEIKVEYGVTRFMAIFEDYASIPRTGGLRSARDQFFQLVIPYGAFYVHEGPSADTHPVNVMIRSYEYQPLDITRLYAGFYVTVDNSRSNSQYYWYDMDGEGVEAAIDARGLDDYRSYSSPIFSFVPYTDPVRVPAEGQAEDIVVGHVPPYYVSYFSYDAASGKYGMSMHNSNTGMKEATIDNNTGTQVSFDNVIVLFAPFSVYPATAPENLPKVDYGVGGGGFYFSQGGWERFVWRKGAPDNPLLLHSLVNDDYLQVNPGTTYLAVVDDTLSEDFYELLLSGDAGQMQGSGVVDPNQNLPDD